ncbi:MAG: type II toxin-antitoxin system HicA family toxin [Gammaproteobacteria bacterium]|nr:type II toxin-antitoxin system HicA family toxin [Gammaproteobacteria bacterium]
MGQIDKLKVKFQSKPNDFTWDELLKVLTSLGYKETQAGKTSGSRVRFLHKRFAPIMLHKPHPSSILKAYQIKQIIAELKNRGQL